MTGRMLDEIEKILLADRPDWVVVYGDTNSTLAGALAASKLHIPVCHVEAGLRSWNRRMPEEVNRVLTDHVSNKLFCSSAPSVENLRGEGITKGWKLWVGDVMADASRLAQGIIERRVAEFLNSVDPAVLDANLPCSPCIVLRTRMTRLASAPSSKSSTVSRSPWSSRCSRARGKSSRARVSSLLPTSFRSRRWATSRWPRCWGGRA